MAIGHVNTQLASSTGATSITLTKPTGLAEGHLMIAAFCIESASNLVNSAPSGWTMLYRSVIGTRTHTQYAYYKIATASDVSASNFVWGFSSSIENAGFISAWSGIKTSAPIGDFVTSTANASSTSAVCPIIVMRANNVSLCIASSMYGTTWTAPSGSTPTYTEIADRQSAASSSGLSIHASWGTVSSTGATTTKTCTAVNADYWKAAQIEIVDASYSDEIPEIFVPPAPHALLLNKSHPHAQALTWAHVFSTQGGGLKAEDLALDLYSSDIVGGAAVDSRGYLVLDGNDDAVKFPTSIGTYFSHSKSSFAAGFRWRESRADGSNSQIFIASASAATNPRLNLLVTISGQLTLQVIGTTSTNYYELVVHESLQNGKWYHVFVSQSGDNARIYINGKYVVQTGVVGGTGTTAYWFNQVSGTIYYCLGAWWTSTTYDYANIDLAYFYHWDDDGQYAEQSGFPALITQDPYAMFRPQRRDHLNLLSTAATYTKTVSLDSLLSKLDILKTTSLDSYLTKQVPITLSIDSILAKIYAIDTSLDSLLNKLDLTRTTSLDSLLNKLDILKTVSLDALLNKLDLTRFSSLDAFLFKTGLDSVYIDALLHKLDLTKSVSIDAFLYQIIYKTISLDSLLNAVGLTQTFLIDSILQHSGIERTASLDSVLNKLELIRTTSLDAFLAYLGLKDVSLDAVLYKLDLTKTTSLDAALHKTGLSVTTSIDAFLQILQSETISLDSLLNKASQTLSTFLDAQISKEELKTLSLDSVLNKLDLTKTTSLDSLLHKLDLTKTLSLDAILFAITGSQITTSLDAALHKLDILKTTSLDSLIYQILTKQLALDAILFYTGTRPVNIDSLLNKTGILKTLGLDAQLYISYIKTLGLDAFLNKIGIQTSLSIDALLGYGGSLPVLLDAYLNGVQAKTFSIDSLLNKANILTTLSIDSLLARSHTLGTDIDAITQKTFLQQPTLDAILWKTLISDLLLDSLLTKQQTKSAVLDAITFNLRTISTNLDAYFIKESFSSLELDALLSRAGQTKTVSIDAELYSGSIKDIYIDAILSGTIEVAASMDSLLHKINMQKQTLLDAIIYTTLVLATPKWSGFSKSHRVPLKTASTRPVLKTVNPNWSFKYRDQLIGD